MEEYRSITFIIDSARVSVNKLFWVRSYQERRIPALTEEEMDGESMTMSHCVNAFQQICNGSASTTEKKKSTIMLSVVAEPFSDDPSGMHFASVFTLSLFFSLCRHVSSLLQYTLGLRGTEE